MLSWMTSFMGIVTENPLLGRLTVASFEVLALALLVVGAIRLFRIRSARVRAMLWLLVLAKPIMSLSLGAPVPLYWFEMPEPAASSSIAEAGVLPSAVLEGESIDAIIERQLALDAEALARYPQRGTAESVASQSGVAAVAASTQAHTASFRLPSPGTVLTFAWLTGMGLLVFVTARDLRGIRRLRLEAEAAGEPLQERLRALAAEYGLTRAPRLFVTDSLSSPALVGYLRPDIFLPRWLAAAPERHDLDWILRHELMHYRLNDPVALAVRRLAEVLFFFHPVVWWAGRRWEEAMELACDRALVTNEPEAHAYAQELFRVLEHQHRARPQAAACGLHATRSQVGQRISALLTDALATPARLSALTVGLLTLFAVGTLFVGIGFADDDEAPEAAANQVDSAEEETVASTDPYGLTVDTRLRLKKLGDEFRSVSVALASYHVDWDSAPLEPKDLTTPVAYLRQVPRDPFRPDEPLLMRMPGKDLDNIFAVSVGPNGVLDTTTTDVGVLAYDPAMGRDGDVFVVFEPTGEIAWIPVQEVWDRYMCVDCGPEVPDASNLAEAAARTAEAVAKTFTGGAKALVPQSPEPDVRAKVSRAQSDLRSMHTALEAYRIDYNRYPDHLQQLTTPISYMTDIFDDPFAEGTNVALAPGIEAPEGEPQWYRRSFSENWDRMFIYSVGPDATDQGGRLEYDPTNGTQSEGDVVRFIELGNYYQVEDEALQRQMGDQQDELEALVSSVEAYYLDNKALPNSLESISGSTGYLPEIPDDRFAQGHKVRYHLTEEGKTARIYSIGPDRIDDRGELKIKGRYAKGEIPRGDIVASIESAEIDRRYKPATDTGAEAPGETFLTSLEELREENGRDNALIHYARAGTIFARVPNNLESDRIRETLENGWSESSELLVPLLRAHQPVLDEIRQGARIDYVKGPGVNRGFSTPVPNYLAIQIGTKLLGVEGRKHLSEGNAAAALESNLAALKMGADLNYDDAPLISGLISVAARAIATNQIIDIIETGRLKKVELQSLIARLQEIERRAGSSRRAFEGEANLARVHFESMFEQFMEQYPKAPVQEQFEMRIRLQIFAPDGSEEFRSAVKAMQERILREHDQLWTMMTDYVEKPVYERNPEKYNQEIEKLTSKFHPLLRMAVPNFLEADVRYKVAEAKLRHAIIAAALEWYRLDAGKYPSSLSDLVPAYLYELPIDPFSGRNFAYATLLEGKEYVLYSIGPDAKSNEATVTYDPTNGTVSSGDLVP